MRKNNLTLRYAATQFTYWAASTGAASFAAIYLMDRGIPSGQIGILLAVAGIIACISQPFLASLADQAKKVVLIPMLVLISLLCMGCFMAQLLAGIPMTAAGVIYVTALCCSDAMVPLLNALSVSYQQAGYEINYGMARGIGSLASGLASLVLGMIFAQFGRIWMLLFLLGFRLWNVLLILSFPKIGKQRNIENEKMKSCSVGEFFTRYKWYCVSLLAILFLGMYHAMTENYMIAIMQRLGGDSSHVGTALFISSIAGAPVIFFYGSIRRHCRDANLMKIAAVSFLVKSAAFYLAPSIHTIYALQLLQITSYGLLGPAQVYYARNKVKECDMVKGQAFITAAYALGCSLGNFTGGQMLNISVSAMLLSGIMMALTGTVLMFLTVDKSDLF